METGRQIRGMYVLAYVLCVYIGYTVYLLREENE